MQKDALMEARILIVDDQEPIIRLLQQILKQAGYSHLEHTTDPREVVSLSARFHPDLILRDMNMPHMDGLQVMEALRDCIPSSTRAG
jgi:CheY-like chemotaxis protein